ncbi:MAG: DotU family type IV/VI secretion system protein [Planctomycetes bacterium]|nr:DotU family type IV/VI secretion system protein [Planctomycetota bacterium]
MTLTELVSELFLYLVVFRRKVAARADLQVTGVAHDLEMIVDRMDKNAEEDPAVAERYRRMRKVLVAVADGLVAGSEWEHALDYRTSCLLENRYYQSNEGGDFFYDELQRLAADRLEEREIFFTALALGFQGRLARQADKRMDEKRKLYRGLPGKLVDAGEKVTPQAYEHTDRRDCTIPPVARFGRYAILLAGILLFFLILGRVVYRTQKATIGETVNSLTSGAPWQGGGT